jgi:hypothetical protein
MNKKAMITTTKPQNRPAVPPLVRELVTAPLYASVLPEVHLLDFEIGGRNVREDKFPGANEGGSKAHHRHEPEVALYRRAMSAHWRGCGEKIGLDLSKLHTLNSWVLPSICMSC